MTLTTQPPFDAESWTTVELLDKFLRGELAAVESYDVAQQHIDDDTHRLLLERCQASHARRAELLREAVDAHGGTPSEDPGPWGVVVKLVERGASAIGDEVAIGALHAGELRGLRDYETNVDVLTTPARNLLWRRVIPQQRMTVEAMADLKRELSDD